MTSPRPFDAHHLRRRPANCVPLTPLAFLDHACGAFPDHPAVVDGDRRLTYAALARRARALGATLASLGVGDGDVVSVLAPNSAAMLEAHYGVPLAGGVLGTLNVRLDAATIAAILDDARSRVLIVDQELEPLARAALARASATPTVVIVDPAGASASDYESRLAAADPTWTARPVTDEWDAIALNYTSGTTGVAKGVVYHHRGAWLTSVANHLAMRFVPHPVYLWTLPMFHCNGWCNTWAVTYLAGTHVCLRRPEATAISRLIDAHRVTHLSGAPVILSLLLQATERRQSTHVVEFSTGGAPPTAAVLERADELGFRVTHTYGLTETYGPAAHCWWHDDWDLLPLAERAQKKARQGRPIPSVDRIDVRDAKTHAPVPADGVTVGEVMIRGNGVMKGYLGDAAATELAFAGELLHTGDLAVLHPDGYVQLVDRAKDVIISGGENISSLEIEAVLARHPAVVEVAVVARPDALWGETPCAFVALRDDASATGEELIAFCREHLAHFKAPRAVIFGALPRTATGKVQKNVLRDRARE